MRLRGAGQFLWKSEYLKVLYRRFETIAFHDTNGMWFLKDFSECSLEDFDREYYRDEFAMMHFGMNVGKILELKTDLLTQNPRSNFIPK